MAAVVPCLLLPNPLLLRVVVPPWRRRPPQVLQVRKPTMMPRKLMMPLTMAMMMLPMPLMMAMIVRPMVRRALWICFNRLVISR